MNRKSENVATSKPPPAHSLMDENREMGTGLNFAAVAKFVPVPISPVLNLAVFDARLLLEKSSNSD
jgi:hypothetical protein